MEDTYMHNLHQPPYQNPASLNLYEMATSQWSNLWSHKLLFLLDHITETKNNSWCLFV